jgi:hypothetical protein
MADMVSSKRKPTEDVPMLTPPTPRVNSFSQASISKGDTTLQPSDYSESVTAASRVTPPSTASPLKYPRNTISPERQYLNHDGVTSFGSADPPLADLLAPPPSFPQERRTTSSSSSLSSTSRNDESTGHQNNTIVNTIRELGYEKYLQEFTPAKFLPSWLRPSPVTTLAPVAPSPRTTPRSSKKKAASKQPRGAAKSSRMNTQAPPNKRKRSEVEQTPEISTPPTKRRKSADPVLLQRVLSTRARTAPPTNIPTKASPAKASLTKANPIKANPTKAIPTKATSTKATSTKASPAKAIPTKASPIKATPTKTSSPTPTTKIRKTSKKATNIGTSKLEKSRTKEQRWGDYLKHLVNGEKDAYHKLPDLAIPPLGQLIDQAPVRAYGFNKGKVQEYGNGQGLHPREMELAREVGLSYDAYRQQKRMAFIGYAAMQLEGKKDFKKSHTQSLCNIDGNKATHLWIHFHECWGWMPEHPTPPMTRASLGNLALPDLIVAQPGQ